MNVKLLVSNNSAKIILYCIEHYWIIKIHYVSQLQSKKCYKINA